MPRNDDLSLILAKAKDRGFFPDVEANEVDYWEKRAKDLFKEDITFLPSFASSIGILYAAIAARNLRPVVFAAVGSSTFQGGGASTGKGVMPVFFANLQAAYPLENGTPQPLGVSLATALATPPTQPGIQYFNASVGGTRSDNYLTATTLPQVASLQPSVILHCVGSNDWGADMPISTYEANMKEKLDALDAAITVKPLHILVQPHQRKDATVTLGALHSWDEYGSALKRIAQDRPDNVLFIDTTAQFIKAGTLGNDPYQLLQADLVHLRDAGHAMLADLIRQGLGLATASSSLAISIPTTARIFSDGFSTNGEIKDRTTDSLLGGSTKTWVSGDTLPSGFKVLDGTLQIDTANSVTKFVGVSLAPVDAQLSFKLVSVSTASSFLIDLYRVTSVISPTPDTYRVEVQTNGDIHVRKRVSGVTTTLFTLGSGSGPEGHNYTLRYYKGFLSLIRNGVTLYSVAENSVAPGGFAGVSRVGNSGAGSGGLANFAVDYLS